MKCDAQDCERKSVTKIGYCLMHYKRWKKNGTIDRINYSYNKDDVCNLCNEAPVKARGLCNACYLRWWYKGTAERSIARKGTGSINSHGHKLCEENGIRFYEHRRIAEIKIGRPLKQKEVVHHIDGDPSNNDPSNLEVLANQSEHAKLHKFWTKKSRKKEDE